MTNAGDTEPGRERVAAAIARVLHRGALAALATIIEAPTSGALGAKILIEESGATAGTTGDAALDQALAAAAALFLASRSEAGTFRAAELAGGFTDAGRWKGARILFERIEPEPRVVVCGAGHVGAALARLARAIGYGVTLIDDRADFVARERFPEEEIALIAAEDWGEAVREAIGTGRGVFAAVVTRGHNEDEECLRAVLGAAPDYVGMIGSRRRTNIVLERLREAGFDERVLRQVRAPIGLDIGAVSPEEVALAILAEIVAARRGGTCAPLSAWRRE